MEKDPERFFELLTEANPWWDSGDVPSRLAPPYRRRDFFVLRRGLGRRPITALSGPRQVGKTTLMYQLLRDLLESGVPRSHLLFVSFDLPGLNQYTPAPLNDAIRMFEERVLGEGLRTATGPVYVLLDEITKLPGWHRDLKGWFDFGYDVRFLVSSSSGAELAAGASESLTGRVATHLLLSWKFVDVMAYRTGDTATNDAFLEARSGFAPAVRRRDPRILLAEIARRRPKSTSRRISIRRELEWYLLVDGFPELVKQTDTRLCARRIDEYLKLTLAHDLYRFHQIRSSTRVFEELLGLIAAQSGCLVSYRNMAEVLHLEERTLMEYLEYLEGAFLISRAPFYSKRRESRLRKQRKIYVPNPAILNVLRSRLDRSVFRNATELGQLAESVVHGYAKRLAFNLAPGASPDVFYWRDRKDREVDVVIEVMGEPIPIEVKYRADPSVGLEGLHRFLEEKNPPMALVVTRDVLKADPPVLFLPLEDFLMLA